MKREEIDVLYQAIEKFIEDENGEKLDKIVKNFHSFELYELVKSWPISKLVTFFELIGAENSSLLFKEFGVSEQIELIESFNDKEINEIFSEYYTDESVDILEEFPYKIIQKVLNTLDIKEKIKINRIFTFAKHQAGFHMIIDFVSVKNNQLIKEIKIQIKKEIEEKEHEIIGNIFVIDDEKKLLGYIKPDVLFVANDKDNIDDYTEKIDTVRATENISMAESIMSKFNVPSAPVVDNNGVLLGIIEADDVIEMYEQVEESFLESSNIKLTNESYMDASVFSIFKSRVWWIIALLFVGSITQIIVMGFQSWWTSAGIWAGGEGTGVAVSSIVTLALANSLSVASSVNDAAGNSGSQTSATMIRALAIGEITKKDYGKVIYKEFRVSFLIGSVSAIASFIRMIAVWFLLGTLMPSNLNDMAIEHNQTVSWVLGWLAVIAAIASFTFFVSIIIGNFVGAVLPIYSHSRGTDGAIISGPVQTTIVDIITFAVYLTLTSVIFVPLSSGYFAV